MPTDGHVSVCPLILLLLWFLSFVCTSVGQDVRAAGTYVSSRVVFPRRSFKFEKPSRSMIRVACAMSTSLDLAVVLSLTISPRSLSASSASSTSQAARSPHEESAIHFRSRATNLPGRCLGRSMRASVRRRDAHPSSFISVLEAAKLHRALDNSFAASADFALLSSEPVAACSLPPGSSERLHALSRRHVTAECRQLAHEE